MYCSPNTNSFQFGSPAAVVSTVHSHYGKSNLSSLPSAKPVNPGSNEHHFIDSGDSTYQVDHSPGWNDFQNDATSFLDLNLGTVGITDSALIDSQLLHDGHNYLAIQTNATSDWNSFEKAGDGSIPFAIRGAGLISTADANDPITDNTLGSSFNAQGLGMDYNDTEWQPSFLPHHDRTTECQAISMDTGFSINDSSPPKVSIVTQPPHLAASFLPNPTNATLAAQGPQIQIQQAASQVQSALTAAPTTTATCAHCNKTLTRASGLARHLSSVHGINQARFHCPIAGCCRNRRAGYSRADKVTEHLWKKHAALGYVKRA